ncbi:SMI1/KNR4 family protein [Hymenobacter cheonanensis]|uniref:SMI1/KNR4 family protein n=1 Tax=Hymenobacter sp. CA2-7 TaxID=3063993 RepID=UPI002713B3FD|nr:SMI1/KNR4 family protein [Hymenobacter sp. CA2-7]MDO7886256.1 SMI1/KNR4 family protein [Hymenobacter sp. CA2-7]
MREYLEKYLEKIEQLGGDSRKLIFERPATEQEVTDIELELTCAIPDEFRSALLAISSHLEFRWFLPEDLVLPDSLRQIFAGELHWGVDLLVQFNESKDGWIKEVFSNPADEYDKVWYNKFVFQEVGNGDYISIDLAPRSYGKIVYLSHDDGEGHGYVMANSFSELLRNWVKLGCVGGEDWQWLPFCENKIGGIDPSCENAQLWYDATGIR